MRAEERNTDEGTHFTLCGGRGGRSVSCWWRNAGFWATTGWQRTCSCRYDGGEAGNRWDFLRSGWSGFMR